MNFDYPKLILYQPITKMTDENLLIAVKSNCKRQFNEKNEAIKDYDDLKYDVINFITDEDKAFEYTDKYMLGTYVMRDTFIDDYTLKKSGKVIKAHYNLNKRYVGAVSRLGEDIFKTRTWVKFTKKNFAFDNTKDGYKKFVDLHN